jgi:hypothetical protein
MFVVRLLAVTALCTASCLAEPLDDAFHRLYNFDFAGAHRILDDYIAKHPADPLGHTVRASTFLFSELDRLRILEAEFLTDDKKISGDDKLTPDPGIRTKLFASIDKAQQLADARLKSHHNDIPALFSYCLTEGLRTDYMAFVEKKQLRSLFAHKKSQSYAVRILKLDPKFVDAYLTTGLSEYIMGSLPFFVRWVVRMEQVKGSKEQAKENLQKVAQSGRYLGPFARILLSIIHVREKRPQQAMTLLDELTRQFPENHLLRKELTKLRTKHAVTGGS